jgi:hypothetical protein
VAEETEEDVIVSAAEQQYRKNGGKETDTIRLRERLRGFNLYHIVLMSGRVAAGQH